MIIIICCCGVDILIVFPAVNKLKQSKFVLDKCEFLIADDSDLFFCPQGIQLMSIRCWYTHLSGVSNSDSKWTIYYCTIFNVHHKLLNMKRTHCRVRWDYVTAVYSSQKGCYSFFPIVNSRINTFLCVYNITIVLSVWPWWKEGRLKFIALCLKKKKKNSLFNFP